MEGFMSLFLECWKPLKTLPTTDYNFRQNGAKICGRVATVSGAVGLLSGGAVVACRTLGSKGIAHHLAAFTMKAGLATCLGASVNYLTFKKIERDARSVLNVIEIHFLACGLGVAAALISKIACALFRAKGNINSLNSFVLNISIYGGLTAAVVGVYMLYQNRINTELNEESGRLGRATNGVLGWARSFFGGAD
jgi:hypothetical protein